MPGTVSVSNAQGAPTIPPDADFGAVVIGYSTSNPVTTGLVTPPYSNPQTAAQDMGLGDAVDCLLQGIVPRQPSNPSPPGISLYSTPPTTPGVRGATLTVSGVTGTSVVTKTAATHPAGTYEPVARVLQGGTVGTGPIIIQFSPNNGRNWLPPQPAITTATTIKMQIDKGNGTLVDTGVQYDLAAGNLNTGDTWSESKTTPPMWADADLYSGSTPAGTAFGAIAQSGNSYGLVVISEPVVSGDIATLVNGLNYLATFNKRPTLIVRFRDPNSGETDAQYVTAFQTFRAAFAGDSRIVCVVGSGWLTDAFRSIVWFRSGLPSLLARLQANQAFPGRQYGEKLAKSPAFGGDGPLPDFSLVDGNQNPISQAHDEFVTSGVDGPLNGVGGGLTFCYQRAVGVAGTYVSEAPCMYPAGSTVLTLMDSRVTQGIQRELYVVAWDNIQGTDVVNGGLLDPDVCLAMSQAGKAAILAKFRNEIANPDDPNLVSVDPAVTVSGPNVSVRWNVNDRLFLYTNGITITLYNIRGT